MRLSTQPQAQVVDAGSWRCSVRGRCAGSGARKVQYLGRCFCFELQSTGRGAQARSSELTNVAFARAGGGIEQRPPHLVPTWQNRILLPRRWGPWYDA